MSRDVGFRILSDLLLPIPISVILLRRDGVWLNVFPSIAELDVGILLITLLLSIIVSFRIGVGKLVSLLYMIGTSTVGEFGVTCRSEFDCTSPPP